jgi:small subunit ribosomal protein S4
MEKQKAKYSYGILEKQRFIQKHQLKVLLVKFLQLCEARLDNVVFRMGIAPSRRGARQLVSQTRYR